MVPAFWSFCPYPEKNSYYAKGPVFVQKVDFDKTLELSVCVKIKKVSCFECSCQINREVDYSKKLALRLFFGQNVDFWNSFLERSMHVPLLRELKK